jgi:hypothetical protein
LSEGKYFDRRLLTVDHQTVPPTGAVRVKAVHGCNCRSILQSFVFFSEPHYTANNYRGVATASKAQGLNGAAVGCRSFLERRDLWPSLETSQLVSDLQTVGSASNKRIYRRFVDGARRGRNPLSFLLQEAGSERMSKLSCNLRPSSQSLSCRLRVCLDKRIHSTLTSACATVGRICDASSFASDEKNVKAPKPNNPKTAISYNLNPNVFLQAEGFPLNNCIYTTLINACSKVGRICNASSIAGEWKIKPQLLQPKNS